MAQNRLPASAAKLDLTSFSLAGWLSLETADNDPSRFWHYFIAICQTFKAGLGEYSLAALQAFTQPPFEPQSWETILISLLNELSQIKAGGVLVLEDFHTITSAYINQSLEFFLDHLPSQFHINYYQPYHPSFALSAVAGHK